MPHAMDMFHDINDSDVVRESMNQEMRAKNIFELSNGNHATLNGMPLNKVTGIAISEFKPLGGGTVVLEIECDSIFIDHKSIEMLELQEKMKQK